MVNQNQSKSNQIAAFVAHQCVVVHGNEKTTHPEMQRLRKKSDQPHCYANLQIMLEFIGVDAELSSTVLSSRTRRSQSIVNRRIQKEPRLGISDPLTVCEATLLSSWSQSDSSEGTASGMKLR
jgi:hypothetical protein